MKKTLLMLFLIYPMRYCIAEYAPERGDFDPRVRIVDYNPNEVIKITTFYGVSTHIELSQSETVIAKAAGDTVAWQIAEKNNHLFIKPQAEKADTNLTVVTNKRTYQFALVVHPRKIQDEKAWKDPNLIFSLKFNYPDDIEAKKRADEATQKTDVMNQKLQQAKNNTLNTDYWVAGSEEISPSEAKDDGRFIYLKFTNNHDMPAVYSVDNQGNEALINTNVVDGNTIVIQRLVPSLILRKGEYVASVINKAFNLDDGMDNLTGTVSPDVKRTIKQGKN